MSLVKLAFWKSVLGLAWTHLGYPLALAALHRLLPRTSRSSHRGDYSGTFDGELPLVSLIVAAHDEGGVIADKVANALALDYPRDRLEIIVASDGSTDRTAELARAAGADAVLELPRGGKLAAQDAAAARARGDVLAFSDANCLWERDALRALVTALSEDGVGYACGHVVFSSGDGEPDGTANEEGAYWRYEMAVREMESALGGVTAGNGAIYAVRRDAYLPLAPSRSHDLSFPFMLRKRGWRSVDAASARASEKMVPTIEGEFERKRRMMRGLWDIVVTDGMADPRGYDPLYAFQIFSHRVLRYLSPLLHVIALITSIILAPFGGIYRLALAAQLALLAAAAAARSVPSRLFAIPYYYVLTTASIAAGLWDRFRDGPPAAWEKSEGTR